MGPMGPMGLMGGIGPGPVGPEFVFWEADVGAPIHRARTGQDTRGTVYSF